MKRTQQPVSMQQGMQGVWPVLRLHVWRTIGTHGRTCVFREPRWCEMWHGQSMRSCTRPDRGHRRYGQPLDTPGVVFRPQKRLSMTCATIVSTAVRVVADFVYVSA